MDGELDRLRKMYAELGEEHLLDLSGDRENLTGEAQLALGEEMRRRGLTARSEISAPAAPEAGEERADGFGVGVPGIFPGAAPAVEQALEPEGEERMGMVRLITFYDGMQLSQACDALEGADVSPAIEEIAGDATVGQPSSFQVWVDAADVDASKAALRRSMGLFPAAEAAEIEEDAALAEVTEGTVGSFESEGEAEEVRAALSDAGFVTVSETEPGADGKVWTEVKVRPEEYGRAMAFLERRMRVQ